MRVLLFTDTFYDANGVSKFLQNIATEASRNQKDLQIITSTRKTCGKNDDIKNLQNFDPIFTIKIPFYKELDLALPNFRKLLAFSKEAKPNFIHISTPGPIGLCGLFMAKKLNLPASATYHTDFPQYVYKNTKVKLFRYVTKKYMKFFYGRCDYVFTRSNYYVDILKQDINLQRDKILPIKPGIDLDKFKPFQIPTKPYGFRESDFNILYVGRLTAEKNFDFLLKVWDLFFASNNSRKAINFIAVGEGKILKEAGKYKSKNVHFLGYKTADELAEIYSMCDLFVFASTTETLGQVVMEAQACALPAIVANSGGHLEIIADGVQALPLDANLWCSEMQNIFDDENLRNDTGAANLEFISNYSIKNSFFDFWGKITNTKDTL